MTSKEVARWPWQADRAGKEALHYSAGPALKSTPPVPPDAFEFLGAIPTRHPSCWIMRCPSCNDGVVAVVHEPNESWRFASEIGCTEGCSAPDIAWWHLWRQGFLPPSLPATEPERRYSQAVVRRLLTEIPDRPTADRLRGVAYQVGRYASAGDLDHEPLTKALATAAARSGITSNSIITALLAGRAVPARLPL